MNKQKILFIDRDGTLLVEPPDKQIDTLEKLHFMPGVFVALNQLKNQGYRFVLVSNQDGLGTQSFPFSDFELPQKMMLSIFQSQGIVFDAVRLCPHFAEANCDCRKPKIGLVLDYLNSQKIDSIHSYVIGDRESDLLLAKNLGIQGIQIGVEPTLTWSDIVKKLLTQQRKAIIQRQTNETNITLEVNLDDPTVLNIKTGIAFFDHMLMQLALHGGFGLNLQVQGDLVVDDHHTVEDTALVLGQAMAQALGDKRGIGRYGFILPMDEAVAQICLDLCGRAYFNFSGKFTRETIGELSTECVPHFFRSLTQSLGAALHITLTGENTHHQIEALFKGVGRSFRQAIHGQMNGIPSTKGVL